LAQNAPISPVELDPTVIEDEEEYEDEY